MKNTGSMYSKGWAPTRHWDWKKTLAFAGGLALIGIFFYVGLVFASL